MTHDELIQRAVRWLRSRRCGVILTELVTSSPETPDAIGWSAGGLWSCLIECKVSLSDFYADAKKQGRSMLRAAGLGRERYYMAPAGVLDAARVRRCRPRWGLLEVHNRQVRTALKAIPFGHECRAKELSVLYSCVWRVQHNLGVGAIDGQVRA